MKKIFPSIALTLTALTSLGTAPAFAQETESSAADPSPRSTITFPRELNSDTGTVVIHTPQIDTWKDFETIAARSVVEVTPAGDDKPAFGVIEFTAGTDPNLELRMVAVEKANITATSFPDTSSARRLQLDKILRQTVQPQTQYVPLDVILSYIAPDAEAEPDEGLSFEPPPIYYSSTPAALVITDGEPLLAPIDDTKLKYAVNTNWDLFQYKENTWYLRYYFRWLKAKELGNEWKYTNSLPKDFKKLPEDGNWTDTKAAIPPEKGSKKNPPTVFYSERPAELIVTDGQPRHKAVGSPGLRYVENTESDVFRYGSNYYYLVSGRWFKADRLRGPWTHVKELPKEFASIPPGHKKAHVLAAVPGTDEARMAVLEARMPRKATIMRDAGGAITVFYQGEPAFVPITGTNVMRATNSPNDVFMVGDAYYLCDNAVWYLAASPNGPWTVATQIPVEIYSIPASSPSHHVTNVYVYDSDDKSVNTGYTSGYFSVYVGYGVPIYGSGWYYPSYYGYYGYYPYYYPYPYSYGASSWYNPQTGRYGRSASVYGPYGGYGRSASYNPKTGTYARGEAAWDSNEIAGRGVAYNPRTGTGVATNRYANESGGWGNSMITHNDKWVETQSEWTNNSRTTDFTTSEGGSGTIDRQQGPGNSTTGSGQFQRGDQTLDTKMARGDQGTVIAGQTGDGRTGAIGRTAAGDLYASRDGEVYKRSDDGWYQRSGEDWSKVEVPDERAAQIDERRQSFENKRQEGSVSRESLEARRQDRTSADGARQNRMSSGTSRGSGSSRSSRSFDSKRRSELNRSREARNRGYSRYETRRSNSGRSMGSGRGNFGGGARRGGGGGRRR